MLRFRRPPRKIAVVVVLAATALSVCHRPTEQVTGQGAVGQSVASKHAAAGARGPSSLIAVTTVAAITPAGGGLCSVPGIGDIGGLLGFCALGSSGLTGTLNNLCQPSVPQPESATSGVDALIRPPATAGGQLATPYNQYGMAGQYWAATNLQCSDMTSLIGNDVAGMIFDFAKALDRVTITIYQSAA